MAKFFLYITFIVIYSNTIAQEIDEDIFGYFSFLRGESGAYFCNDRLRGLSDQIRLETSQRSMYLTGNLVIQTNFILIKTENITVVETENGFYIHSNSIKNQQIEMIVGIQPIELKNCELGIIEFEDKNIEYKISTNILEWTRVNELDSISIRGNPSIINQPLDISFYGNKIDITINNNKTEQIKIQNNFELNKDNQQLTANFALVDITENNIIAVGDVQLKIENYSLIKAERLEVGLGEQRNIIAEKINSDLFLVR